MSTPAHLETAEIQRFRKNQAPRVSCLRQFVLESVSNEICATEIWHNQAEAEGGNEAHLHLTRVGSSLCTLNVHVMG